MYIGAGDAGSGEQRDSRRLNPQRLDTLVGKILRIVPDLREHTATSTVSENGRYRIPNDNPFSTARGRAQGDLGLRPAQSASARLGRRSGAARRAACCSRSTSGSSRGRRSSSSGKGANYGYPLREGTQMMSRDGMSAVPEDDTIPIQISDTVARGTVKPTYPVIQYPHTAADGGDAIAGGFVYRGRRIPALRGKLVFGDITTGRIWYAELADVLAADDGNAATVAPIHEIDAGLRRLVEDTYRARGGKGEALPGVGAVSGRGRVDIRFAVDNEWRALHPDEERRHDQEGRGCEGHVVAHRATLSGPGLRVPARTVTSQPPRGSRIPWRRRPRRSPPGRSAYDANCAACHGNVAQGAVKAGVVISIIEEQGGKQAPDLTDGQWDHGSSDGDIYAVIKRGVPPTMMAGYDGRIPDNDIWNIVNYIRSLAPKK